MTLLFQAFSRLRCCTGSQPVVDPIRPIPLLLHGGLHVLDHAFADQRRGSHLPQRHRLGDTHVEIDRAREANASSSLASLSRRAVPRRL